MKKSSLSLALIVLAGGAFAQAGHIMQGMGAVNMSMGGASTAQPIDINGAIHWNSASIAAFKNKQFSINAGTFFSAPQVTAAVPTQQGTFSGTTKDDRGVSIMPALSMVWGKKDSKHHWGVSAFGVSGFGVTFPQNSSNPINMPQSQGGFGQIKSDYMMMQVGVTYAYEISDKVSIGFQPTFNWGALQLEPNPLASPSQTLGYPKSDKASAFGAGAQVGIYYNSGKGIKLGASYKSQQYFGDFKFDNTYLNGTPAPAVNFKMNYPAILSAGFGYSNKAIDFALDYRFVNYEKTDGFEAKGWTNTASVKGFGWKNISIISAGMQYKLTEKVPVRLGYTYSSNPINSDLAFFSAPAPAIIKHGFQIGTGLQLGKHGSINATYHHGSSGGSVSGPILNPMMISSGNPYGAIPGSSVSYKMTTDLFMLGYTYQF